MLIIFFSLPSTCHVALSPLSCVAAILVMMIQLNQQTKPDQLPTANKTANNHHNNQQPHQQLQVPKRIHLSDPAAVQQQQPQQQQQPTSNNNYPPAAPLGSSIDIAHKSHRLSPAQLGTSLVQPEFILQNSVGGSFSGGDQRQQPPAAQQPGDDGSYSPSVLLLPPPSEGQQQRGFCQPQASARNMHWNFTRAGTMAKQKCPDGSIGEASWLCDANRLRFWPQWSPDFSRCRLSWLERLSQQLDRMLESPGKQAAPEMTRAQNEQILKQILNDLTLMTRSKELFSEDLERIDIMLSQILAQFRSLSVVFGSFDSWRSPVLQGGARTNNFAYLFEDLFKKLVDVVSNLFDASQRSAWLEIKQASERQRLELRFLGHLKEAGLLMANVFGASLANYQFEPIRQPNVFAGFAVINNNGGLEFSSSMESSSPNSLVLSNSEDSNELKVQLRQSQSTGNNRFSSSQQPQLDEDGQQQTLNEFRLNLNVLRELTAKGKFKLLT